MKKLMLIPFLLILFGCPGEPEPPEPQRLPADIFLNAKNGPIVQMNIVSFEVKESGLYDIQASVTYTGNKRRNESFFLSVHTGSAQIVAENANAGEFFVVEDDGEEGVHNAIVSCGLYRLEKGVEYSIDVNHYFLIADSFPEFRHGDFGQAVVKGDAFLVTFEGP